MAKKSLFSAFYFVSSVCTRVGAFRRFACDFEPRRSEFYRISRDLILFAQSRNKTDDP
jgi:hypothetical protein